MTFGLDFCLGALLNTNTIPHNKANTINRYPTTGIIPSKTKIKMVIDTINPLPQLNKDNSMLTNSKITRGGIIIVFISGEKLIAIIPSTTTAIADCVNCSGVDMFR